MTQTHENNETDRRVYTSLLRAGQRTYFFDVKVNRNKHHYLVITESKKRIDSEGRQVFDKYKIHLYHENFDAFSELLKEMGTFLQVNNQEQSPEG